MKTRLVKKDGTQTVLNTAQISVRLDKNKLCIWNGVYWEETSLDDYIAIASWVEQ